MLGWVGGHRQGGKAEDERRRRRRRGRAEMEGEEREGEEEDEEEEDSHNDDTRPRHWACLSVRVCVRARSHARALARLGQLGVAGRMCLSELEVVI